MKKSLYSLLLMDDVIREIDTLAYSMGTSRSNLINQILAEKVALITPEKHMQTIFEEMSKRLVSHQNFQIQSQASDCMYSIKSILRYKYNPTIRYAVTIIKQNNSLLGELKVISRTQNEMLQRDLNSFFAVWSDFERQHHLSGWRQEENVRWVRPFCLNCYKTIELSDEAAEAITEYIQIIDGGLKIFFALHQAGEITVSQMSHYFISHLENHNLKL